MPPRSRTLQQCLMTTSPILIPLYNTIISIHTLTTKIPPNTTGTLVGIHTMCPEVVVYITGYLGSTTSSPVSSMVVTAPYAASKSVVSSVFLSPSIVLIGWLMCCILYLHGLNHLLHLLEMNGKLPLIFLNFICNMCHLHILNDSRIFN